MMISYPVKIIGYTKITQEGQSQRFSIETVGKIAINDPDIWLQYQETDNQSTTLVTFKGQNTNQITLTQKGLVTNRFVFQEHVETHTSYNTLAGALLLDVLSTNLSYAWDKDTHEGDISIDYVLNNGAQHIGSYQVRLQFFQINGIL